MGLVISFINAKGGSGKTTISSNVSHVLSMAGYKVLHADFDPQGSSSETFKVLDDKGNELSKAQILSLNIYDFLVRPANPHNYIFHTSYENLDIIPNAQSVYDIFDNGSFDVKFNSISSFDKYTALRSNLEKVIEEYDFIIIDGQPNINSIMEISIIASDYVVSPACPDKFNLSTVNNTCSIIDYCNQKFGCHVQYLGFFLNNVPDVKDKEYKKVVEFYVNKAKEYFINCPIRFSKAVNKSALKDSLWFDYALAECVGGLPNPCKDLLNLLVHELGLIDIEDKEHLDILADKGINLDFLYK